MEADEIVVRSPRVVPKVDARRTPTLEASGVATRDLARYYALLDRERPGTIVTQAEACLIRDVLPALRAARRDGGELTLATAVEAHVRANGGTAYEVDVLALVDRLRGLRPVQLAAVVDLAERMQAGALRSDFDGRERVRREFGISG